MSIMQSLTGPTSTRRRLLYRVVQSIALYGASILQNDLHINKYRDMRSTLQRKFLVRLASVYFTTSTTSLQIIIGVIPFKILAEERAYLYISDFIPDNGVRVNERLRRVNGWQQKMARKFHSRRVN